MDKIRISLISYLNTLPFAYGITKSEYILANSIIEYDYPSKCLEKLMNNDADIGIIPLAGLYYLSNYYIISDYVIGTNNKMPSVLLSSQVPLNEIKEIYLDYQSRTSVNLVKILAKEFWQIRPEWIHASYGYEEKIKDNTAGVIIGDRALLLSKNYHYNYDLAGEWKKFTSFPFVFAAWVSQNKISTEYLLEFNKALHFGLESIDTIIENIKNNKIYQDIDLKKYLSEDLSFYLDNPKKQGMNLFLKYLKAL
jgi:chorismate dehydratase